MCMLNLWNLIIEFVSFKYSCFFVIYAWVSNVWLLWICKPKVMWFYIHGALCILTCSFMMVWCRKKGLIKSRKQTERDWDLVASRVSVATKLLGRHTDTLSNFFFNFSLFPDLTPVKITWIVLNIWIDSCKKKHIWSMYLLYPKTSPFVSNIALKLRRNKKPTFW